MGKKVISFHVYNEEIWKKFREYVKKKHGKEWGMLAYELEKIIEDFLQHTHTQKSRPQQSTPIKNNVYKSEETVYTSNTMDGGQQTIRYVDKWRSEDIARLNKLRSELMKYVRQWKTNHINKKDLIEMIKKHRWQPHKYIRMLLKLGVIDFDLNYQDHFIIVK